MDGVTFKPHFSQSGKELALEHVQDCTAILEANHEDRREEQRSDWGRHKARIPNVILVKWLNEEWNKGNRGLKIFSDEFNRIVDKKLNDPDYFYLRTDRPALQVGW